MLPNATRKRVPKKAQRIIDGSLGDILPAVGIPAEQCDLLKKELAKCITLVVEEYYLGNYLDEFYTGDCLATITTEDSYGKYPTIPTKYLAKKLEELVENRTFLGIYDKLDYHLSNLATSLNAIAGRTLQAQEFL